MNKNPYVIDRVSAYQNKRGIEYATADGALYKFLKIIYILLFCVNLAFNFFYILVKLVSMDADSTQKSDIGGLAEISLFSLFLIIGLILTVINKTRRIGRLISVAALIASAASLGFITLASESASDPETVLFLNLPLYFILRHALPALCGIIVLLLMLIIDIRASVCYNRLYKRLENELYTQYLSQTSSPNSEEWQIFLAGKNSENTKSVPLKKS